ncbi:MAG: hypothetical protein JWR61_4636 [Ferruginibacter sp.]|uniref:fibrobacter succinogenes major paralogous domain-containing protein n=1 Tax=Ferruginibacter sp. TaxID=1940288 RepID=UPI002659922A|nr:fibrobacter succinogenes major paralogous domain-containing protein [Ferruginibacter sp.]MDB5279681.1 hypothetical protein [Ferruginibacter sp.]
MKTTKMIVTALLLFAASVSLAQVGIGTATPVASAQLDVSSSSKGFLPPRMTQAERDAIQSPVPGLMIWCKDCGLVGEIQIYNGAIWTNMTGSYAATQAPKTVTIGYQEWMTKNLDVVTYRNGDTIPEVTDPARWANLKDTGAWCYYNNDAAKGSIYGRLYNRAAIMDGRGLAPEGWKVPDNIDWARLVVSLGGSTSGGISGSLNYMGGAYLPVNKAGQMRAISILWQMPNSGTTNESGFTALPAGKRNADGSFSSVGNLAKWWSTGDFDAEGPSGIHYFSHLAPELDLNKFSEAVILYHHISPPHQINDFFLTPEGFSVRCLRDGDAAPKSVKIGNAEWMQTNLNVTTYRNGDIIPEVENPAAWDTLTTGAWCYYQGSSFNGAIYGKLYNWYAVHDPRGLAPAGWHIASDAEWNNLTNNLGGESVAGNKIRETGTSHWESPNAGATNETHFTALPGGKLEEGVFKQLGTVGSWWTGTEDTINTNVAWYREVNFYDPNIYRWAIKKQTGFSVRCVKD